jgi:hypothetical protein
MQLDLRANVQLVKLWRSRVGGAGRQDSGGAGRVRDHFRP